MGPSDVFETPLSFIIRDDRFEVAIKKTARPRLWLETVVSQLVEEDIFRGPISGLRHAWLINAIAKQYSKIESRKGEPSPPVQLAELGVEAGKAKASLVRRHISAETTAEQFSSESPRNDRTWGAFDLSSFMQVWERIKRIGDFDKEVQISTCGSALKLTSPDNKLDAYFPYSQTKDLRFRIR
jgi:hypothetical protein